MHFKSPFNCFWRLQKKYICEHFCHVQHIQKSTLCMQCSTYYNRKYTIHYLKKLVKIFYKKQFTKSTTQKKHSKLLQWKMIESTYNVNKHCSLLHALWNCLISVRKRRLIFLLKLLFIKVKGLVNINKIFCLPRNEWRTGSRPSL